jgi:hypothetical protein
MKADDARSVLRENGLINRKISRAVLNAITLGREGELSHIADHRILSRLPSLREEYWQIRKGLPAGSCRNLPFYKMISARHRNFTWKPCAGGVDIGFTYAGIKPSLLSLLTGLIPLEQTARPRRLVALPGLPDMLMREIERVFERVGVVRPEQVAMDALASWVSRGLAGEVLTVVSPVCPDYAVEAGSTAAHRFTFNDVGRGIGVTARRLFDALPDLHCLLRKHLGLTVNHHVCPGDFEAFSAETNIRIGITEAEFLDRLQSSRDALLQEAPAPILSCLFTEFCGGKQGWEALYRPMLAGIEAQEFGNLAAARWVRDIALARRGLYDRWHGAGDRGSEFYTALALRQGAEYATMGMVVAKHPALMNPLVLGADDHRMGIFYHLAAALPVIYLKRSYQ